MNSKVAKIGPCVLLALLITLYPILAELSKRQAVYEYCTITIPLLCEGLKLVVSVLLLINEFIQSQRLHPITTLNDPGNVHSETLTCVRHSCHDFCRFLRNRPVNFHYGFLALLYTVQNNLIYIAMIYLDPGTYQMFSNVKIACTGVLMWAILKRKFTVAEILGIVLLTVGPAISQCRGLHFERTDSLLGILYVSVMVLISSCAGVFNEKFLKDESYGTIHWQNCQLYGFGIIWNSINLKLFSNTCPGSFFHGYNIFVWISLINLSFMGLSMGIILKYTDNIVRLIANVVALLGASLFSIFYMNLEVQPFYIFGLVLSCLGIILYSYKY